MGRYDEALPLYTKCLALRKEALGENHPDTLQSMKKLAALCHSMERYDEAVTFNSKRARRQEIL